MEKIISYCGIICTECPAFNATKTDDNSERRKVAELWTKQYGHPIKSEDINCNGCTSKGPLFFNYCNICEIRKCGQERNVKNCAHCEDYKCEKLSKLHEQAPKLKETLDAINQNLTKKVKN